MRKEGSFPKISHSLEDAKNNFNEYNLTQYEICKLAVGLYNAEVLADKLSDLHLTLNRIESKIQKISENINTKL